MSEFEIVKQLLPAVVSQIAALIGFPATEQLIKNLGGIQLLMAKNLNNIDEFRRNLLIKSVGLENAKLLAQTFGGEMIYIPRCLAALTELRNQSLLHDIDNLKLCGYSTVKALTILCPQYNISDRQAWKLIKARTHSTQLSMFDSSL